MDPLSIVAATFGLGDVMSKTLKEAASFVCDVQSAQADINAITREFTSIRTAMDLLTENFQESIPEPLQHDVVTIIDNCVADVMKIHDILSRFQLPSFSRKLRWAVSGKKELGIIRSSLLTHKNALDMALAKVKLVAFRDIKDDTAEIKEFLNCRFPFDEIPNFEKFGNGRRNGNGPYHRSFTLQRYLDDMPSDGDSMIASVGIGTHKPSKRDQVNSNSLSASQTLSTRLAQDRNLESRLWSQTEKNILKASILHKANCNGADPKGVSNMSLPSNRLPHHQPQTWLRARQELAPYHSTHREQLILMNRTISLEHPLSRVDSHSTASSYLSRSISKSSSRKEKKGALRGILKRFKTMKNQNISRDRFGRASETSLSNSLSYHSYLSGDRDLSLMKNQRTSLLKDLVRSLRRRIKPLNEGSLGLGEMVSRDSSAYSLESASDKSSKYSYDSSY
ncbi:hypothetical protein F4779DRAFT_595719 [Xylariaceae sp. FL0662B]|nr:hypothetical protein F4779DRAFT_595719 [Xylariaceae sp. FL0662B]